MEQKKQSNLMHYLPFISREYLAENNKRLEDVLIKTYTEVSGKEPDNAIVMLQWYGTEYKGQLLTGQEKEYLCAVIKPFRDRVVSISKQEVLSGYSQYITIDVQMLKEVEDKYEENEIDYYGYDTIDLPAFISNTQYKGMECDKLYTIDELGL